MINLRAAWAKANEYYIKLDDSPAYYAATSLHPAYKHYCDNAWRDKPEWLAAAQSAFQALWGTYKDNPAPPPAPAAPRARVNNDLNDAIASMMEPHQGVRVSNDLDEYTRWKLEPWVPSVDNPITYWLSRRRDYPNLTRLALDVLSIPASSCDCERMFSELGDLLRPKRRKISSQLLVAIQSVRTWLRAGFGVEGETAESLLSDEAIDGMYNLGDWHDSEA
ncbi:Dimer-Tnp-hAT dimerization containing protein [Pyrenophora tritici-repentis]|nr:Dimer-Tnp-hAT dimerization containing protein [Pyrenophora tritici-repentis]